MATFSYIVDNAISQIYQPDNWQMWHINVLAAMLLLGILTAILSRSGAIGAFADWQFSRISSQRQARFAVILVGWIVFIDGIFSCLANGNISRPLSERFGIPPGELAYLVDSTASPLTSMVPFSSWGPYVIALIAGINWLNVDPAHAFIEVASYNFYAIATLLMVMVVATTNLGFKPSTPTVIQSPAHTPVGSPWMLGLPILTLLLGSLVLMLVSGARNADELTIAAMFSHADIGAAMRDSCVIAVIVATLMSLNAGQSLQQTLGAAALGIKTMLPAITIIMFTWIIGRAIGDLNAGKIMAGYAADLLSPVVLLPGMFVLCTFIAFSTGSSWGTFAIMIPIGADIAHAIQPEFVLAAISAVMAGSVFGDHCSPISDTTVLAATASGCEPNHHVMTQLPLALLTAFMALCCFTAIGLGISLIVVLAGLIVAMIAIAAITLQRRQ
ncbi:Na+/H+ antiporter NhaC family protein [Ferrimonas lipolytica]|uniref:Na+/H+ antiporter NhaC family protein n=1 Tax=Ferrimonas lipolytica TaxID=2724191 RepID=UPI001EEB0215|nr:Na+/H+ antiporter NhaC family protein [Ferrimonas lipolytica]